MLLERSSPWGINRAKNGNIFGIHEDDSRYISTRPIMYIFIVKAYRFFDNMSRYKLQ